MFVMFGNFFDKSKKIFDFIFPLILLYGVWFAWLWCLVQFSYYDFNFDLNVWQVNLFDWFTILFCFCTTSAVAMKSSHSDSCLFAFLGVLPLGSLLFYFSRSVTSEERICGCIFLFFFFVQYVSLKYVKNYFREEIEVGEK